MLIIRHARGADFRQRVTLPASPETYDQMTCQVRRADLVCDLSVNGLDGSQMVEIHAPAAMTADWPLRLLSCGLRLTVGGEVAHSEEFLIQVLPEVVAND
jgi:hypothetical protein